MEQELLTFPEHLSWPSVFSGIRVALNNNCNLRDILTVNNQIFLRLLNKFMCQFLDFDLDM